MAVEGQGWGEMVVVERKEMRGQRREQEGTR